MELLTISVKQHLDTVSFNNAKDLATRLTQINCTISPDIRQCFTELDPMIQRRHHIVHQADRNDNAGSGNHRYKSISYSQVLKWKKAIEGFVAEVNLKTP